MIWTTYTAVSSINHQNVSNNWSILHLREILCIFKLVLTTWQISYGFHLPYLYGYTLLVYKDIVFDIPKLKLCSIDPEYCVLFFVFCHGIEDECWKHSFKQSMRLKCTARKECIKYIDKCIYLKSFVPKMIHAPCGNNLTKIKLSRQQRSNHAV